MELAKIPEDYQYPVANVSKKASVKSSLMTALPESFILKDFEFTLPQRHTPLQGEEMY